MLALAPWIARLLMTGQLTRRTSFDLLLLFFLLTAGLGVWAAYDRQTAGAKFWLIVGGVLLFYAFVNAEPLGDARVWILSVFGAGVAVYFLATNDWDAYPAKIGALTRLGQVLQMPLPELPVHRLHPNVAGGIMAMMVPFAGLAAIQSWFGPGNVRPGSLQRRLARGFAVGLLALTCFGLLMTTSRGAWLALAVALTLAALWMVSRWLSLGQPRRRVWLFPTLLLALLVLGLVVGSTRPGGLVALLEALPGPNTVTSRADLLRDSLILVRDYLFVGAGLGNFQMLHSTYVALLHVGFTVHGHNLFLNISVEQGLPATLALAGMWILFATALWRQLFGSGAVTGSDPDERPGVAAMGAAALCLVVILVHGLADDVLYGSRATLLLFVPLAYALPVASRRPGRWLSLGAPLAISLVVVLALIWRGPLLSRIYSNLGAVHQSQTELSVYSWPEWPIQDEVRRAVDLSRPVAELERALVFDPKNAAANRRLGMIELSLAEYEDALQHLEAAYQVESQSVTTRQLYGEALIVNGRLEEGQALWARLGARQGQLKLRTFWYEHIGDTQRAAWIGQAAAGVQ
jgi:hypothetical protein